MSECLKAVKLKLRSSYSTLLIDAQVGLVLRAVYILVQHDLVPVMGTVSDTSNTFIKIEGQRDTYGTTGSHSYRVRDV